MLVIIIMARQLRAIVINLVVSGLTCLKEGGIMTGSSRVYIELYIFITYLHLIPGLFDCMRFGLAPTEIAFGNINNSLGIAPSTCLS